jgi:hypothetical protein
MLDQIWDWGSLGEALTGTDKGWAEDGLGGFVYILTRLIASSDTHDHPVTCMPVCVPPGETLKVECLPRARR